MPILINIIIKTLKIEIQNKPSFTKNKIYIFWHSKMFIGWWLFKDLKSTALVSQSKDGDILNNLLNKWNYKTVRGSSSKGGKDAVETLINFVTEGYNAVITPDGPRGPAREIKNGALIISNKCDVPIIPVSINYSSKKILGKSWDKFEIPLPFSKCSVTFGKEVYYKEYLADSELDVFKSKLSAQMK